MSDVMLHGVLNMPIDCWSDNALDKLQRHSRYVQASERILELEKQLEQRAPQWQPIETAPRDGTHILGYWKTMRIMDYPAVLYKDDCFLNPNAFSFVGKVELEEVFPTRWQPVPTPPNKEQP